MNVVHPHVYLEGSAAKSLIEIWKRILESRSFLKVEDMTSALKQVFERASIQYPALVTGFYRANIYFDLGKIRPGKRPDGMPPEARLDIIARVDFEAQTVELLSFGLRDGGL